MNFPGKKQGMRKDKTFQRKKEKIKAVSYMAISTK